MDFSVYTRETRELIDECLRASAAVDPRAPRLLRKLEKFAGDRGDIALLGFAYYYAANWYYDTAQYERYQDRLKRAIHFFLRSGERELLARSYNLFANDAMDKEAYDIAYSYYTNALHFIDEEETSTAAGVIAINLGNLYCEMGELRSGRKYFRKGIRLIREKPDDPFYQQNLLIVHINDGSNSIEMNDVAAAGRSFREASRIFEAGDEDIRTHFKYAYGFFGVRLAFADGQRAKAKEQLARLVGDLRKEPEPWRFMVDIRGFCRAMMLCGKKKEAGEVLAAVDERVMRNAHTQPVSQFIELKVDYYDATRDEKNLTRYLREQQPLLRQQREERSMLCKCSLELVKLVGELQEEEARVRMENKDLQARAETDTLTQTPNRYAMEKKLEEAFERAWSGKQILGVEIMDIDGFKAYNDNYGHRVGDACLEEVGRVLREFCAGRPVFCARYGGDEFVLIYEDMSAAEIDRAAETLGDVLAAATVDTGGRAGKRSITVSQGICAGVPLDKTRPWDYLLEADAALYASKGKKRKAGEKTTVTRRAIQAKGREHRV